MSASVDSSTVKDLRPISAQLAVHYASISLENVVKYGDLSSLTQQDRRFIDEAATYLRMLKEAM